MADDKLGEVYLKDVRLSFPHLFTPSASVKDGKEKYKASFLIDPDTEIGAANLKKLSKAKKAVEAEVFGKTPKYKGDRCCIKKGEDCISQKSGEVYDGYDGMIVVSASTDDQPSLYDREKNKVTEEKGSPFFAGCRVDAIINLKASKGEEIGGTILYAYLNGVMYRRKDEAFGNGGGVEASAFEDVEDDEDEDDEFGLGDGGTDGEDEDDDDLGI